MLDVLQVAQVDSLHYLGNQAIENAIKCTSIEQEHHVLDIGSGMGGPARVLAHLTHCQVDAVELQADLHRLGRALTQKCHLQQHVQHLHADFMKMDIAHNSYDRITSWLVFLHIPQHEELLQRCCSCCFC